MLLYQVSNHYHFTAKLNDLKGKAVDRHLAMLTSLEWQV